jgi:VanZ family protein
MLHTRRAALFLTLYAAVVAYASLYPWEFHWNPHAPPLFWIPLRSRGFVLDFLLNILFYIPLGAAAFLAFDAGAVGLFIAVAAGFGLSLGIELAQRYTLRVGDFDDLTANTLGTVLGAATSFIWKRRHLSAPAFTKRIAPDGAVLATLWIVWNAFLLLPAASRRALPKEASPLAWSSLVNECIGVFALVIALRPHRRTAGRLLAPALLVWLAIQELRPFRWGARQDFSWLPFESLFYSRAEVYYPLLFQKLFFYTLVVWAMRLRGVGWLSAIGIPMAVLAAGEWAQRYLPARTPELTDLVLVAGGAFLLWVAEPQHSKVEVARARAD